jgi:Aspartyl protease
MLERTRRSWRIAMTAVSFALFALCAVAEPPDVPRDVVVLRSRSFNFPTAWDTQGTKGVELVRLFVSDDRGATWKRVSDHKPGDKRAPFKADRDGEFWFSLQTQRTDGSLEPAMIERLTPAMKVRVVTEKPEPAVRFESIAKSAPAASLAETLERRGYVSIELEKMRTGYFGVRVRVSDKKFLMLLDTGAPSTRADPERMKALELPWRHLDEAEFGPGWGKTGYCEMVGMKIGDVDIRSFPVRTKDETEFNKLLAAYGDLPIDGILGADVLEPHGAVIDYPSRTLFLRPTEKK